MTEHIWRIPIKTLGTSVYQYGEEACEGGHAFGPFVRDHFLLHFVTSGKGVFATEDKEYTVSAGEGFFISPNRVTAYRADAAEPWHYFWIGFSGESAEGLLSEIGLSPAAPVFSFGDTAGLKAIFDRVHFLPEDSVKAQLSLVSVLYALLAGIEAKREKSVRGAYRLFHTGKEYADMAALYIEQHYAEHITVYDIAHKFYVSDSSISHHFKQKMGISIYHYVTQRRLISAKNLISKGMALEQVAARVGFSDYSAFYRAFKQEYGISPRQYRSIQEGNK